MARGDLTVDEIMAILPETPGRIAEITTRLTAATLCISPAPGAWSLNDVLGGNVILRHMAGIVETLGAIATA